MSTSLASASKSGPVVRRSLDGPHCVSEFPLAVIECGLILSDTKQRARLDAFKESWRCKNSPVHHGAGPELICDVVAAPPAGYSRGHRIGRTPPGPGPLWFCLDPGHPDTLVPPSSPDEVRRSACHPDTLVPLPSCDCTTPSRRRATSCRPQSRKKDDETAEEDLDLIVSR